MAVLVVKITGVAQEQQEELVGLQPEEAPIQMGTPEPTAVHIGPMVLVVHLFGMDMVQAETEVTLKQSRGQRAVST